MLMQYVESPYTIHKRGMVVLHERGGLENWMAQPDAPQTLIALEILVLNEAQNRSPDIDGLNTDAAFIRRVVSKLKYVLRHMGDLDVSLERKEAILLRSVAKECKRTNQERGGRFLDPQPHTKDQADLDLLPGDNSEDTGGWNAAQSTWWDRLKSHVPSRLAKRASVLASWIEGQCDIDTILTSDGVFDVDEISKMLHCANGETKEILGCWQREADAILPKVPRKLNGICRKLKELLSKPFDGLADSELRERLFDISRSLAASFGSMKIRTRAVRKLDLPGFDDSIDLLLDERKFSESQTDRGTMERLIQTLTHIRDAISSGNVDKAFAHSASLVVDIARLQHHTSQERLQVVLAYSHFLFVAGECEAFYQFNQAIEKRTEALAASQGKNAWDSSPEFASGETLRRIRTYARLNQVTYQFYRQLTTASKERFVVQSYEQLQSLDEKLCQAAAEDPAATFLHDELLVLRTHLVRAAYNQHRRAAKSEKTNAHNQHEQYMEKTRELIQDEFIDRHTGLTDVSKIIRAIRSTAEGCAVERSLDVIEELFAHIPDTAYQIAHERAARIRLCL